MKVYRVQDHKNNGAYTSQAFKRDTSRHPVPSSIKRKIEKANFNTYDFFYGFKSINQMKMWFLEDDRVNLDRDGFFLAVYEVPKKYCFCDKYQVAFFKKKAKFVRDIDLARMK